MTNVRYPRIDDAPDSQDTKAGAMLQTANDIRARQTPQRWNETGAARDARQAAIDKEVKDAAANREEEDAEVAAKRMQGMSKGGKVKPRGWGAARYKWK